jgi:hypothetical protein
VTIDDTDTPGPAPETKSTFYEANATTLQLFMICLALAIDLGSGIALHRAFTQSSEADGEREAVSRELTVVRKRLGETVHEITALRNAPGLFAATFWREFYRTLVTQSLRSAVRKGVGFLLILSCFWSPHLRAQPRANVAVALDLSFSETMKDHDQKTAFQRNIDAITRLLETLSPGFRITVLGTTEDSIAGPVQLLKGELSSDPGYFGDRLAAGRAALVRAWRARAGRLQPTAPGTDILGTLFVASEILRREIRRAPGILIILSDMRNNTKVLNLEAPQLAAPEDLLKAMEGQHQIADLSGVTVYVAGANGGGRDLESWQIIKAFWTAYLEKAGAHCAGYSMLPEAPALAR